MRTRGSARPRPPASCAPRSPGIMPVWYRRRWRNVARKSGNLEEFVTRWGGRYDAHDRARRGQPDRGLHARCGSCSMMHADPGARHPADGAAAHRCAHAVRPAAAVRRMHLRPDHLARTGGVVGRRRKLLGPQRDHPRSGLRRELRAAGAQGPQAVRRPRAVARFRRGGADAPRRLEGAHGHGFRRLLGGIAALADRRRHPRPALGPGQSAAHQDHRRARACRSPAACTSASAS